MRQVLNNDSFALPYWDVSLVDFCAPFCIFFLIERYLLVYHSFLHKIARLSLLLIDIARVLCSGTGTQRSSSIHCPDKPLVLSSDSMGQSVYIVNTEFGLLNWSPRCDPNCECPIGYPFSGGNWKVYS